MEGGTEGGRGRKMHDGKMHDGPCACAMCHVPSRVSLSVLGKLCICSSAASSHLLPSLSSRCVSLLLAQHFCQGH